MPLVPVEHDPFTPGLVPVDHDPWVAGGASGSWDAPQGDLQILRDAGDWISGGSQPWASEQAGYYAPKIAHDLMQGASGVLHGAADLGERLTTDPMVQDPETGEWHIKALSPNEMSAVMALPGVVGALNVGEPGALGAFNVYHGSPHRFDKFDMSKIGTGEGAQAFGHGLYFAENPKIATAYRDALSGDNIDAVNYWLNGKNPDLETLTAAAQDAAQQHVAHPDQARRVVNDIIDALPEMEGAPASEYLNQYDAPSGYEKAYHAAAQALGDVTYQHNPGNFYEAQIVHNPDDFLHWDKPLSEQTPQVQAGLEQSGLTAYANKYFEANNKAAPTGGDLHDFLGYSGYSPSEISAKMSEAGIPGIRYLDRGSRNAAGEPTHNFVLFNDQDVHITGINGQPVTLRPVDHDPFADTQPQADASGGGAMQPPPGQVAATAPDMPQ